MKTFFAVFLLLFLAACGEESTSVVPENTSLEQTSEDINTALKELPEEIDTDEPTLLAVEKEDSLTPIEEVETIEPKVLELSTSYISPKGEMIMNIDINVGENDTIDTIEVTSPNYSHIDSFNAKIQATVGMTLEEASDYHVSGSSLGTEAFQKVLKDM